MQNGVDISTPFGPVKTLTITKARTIWELFYELELPNNRPIVCVLNGKPILRAHWNTLIEPTDEVCFTLIPQGKWFSQILGIIAMAVLAVVAPWLGGIIGPALGISTQLATAVIFTVGSLVINALMPKQQGNSNKVENNSASPTYSLSAQGNTARLYNPIPRMYGKHLLYPDFASMPWSNYENNEQYLYQLLCLGLGDYDVLEVRIENTVLWTSTGGYTGNLEGVDIEIVPPYTQVTLFPAEVQSASEVSGQQLRLPHYNGQASFSGNTITGNNLSAFDKFITGDVIRIHSGVNAGVCNITGINSNQNVMYCDTAFTAATYTTDIDIDADNRWVGGFVINSAATVVNKIQFDVVLSSGLYYLNDSGSLSANSTSVEMQVRKIDSAGLPIGDWTTVKIDTITRSTMTAQRVSYTVDVDTARYEARMRRRNYEEQSTKFQSATYWASVKGFVPDDNTYSDVTLLAIKIRASGQLTSESAHKVNVLQQAKIPVWDGTTWVTQPSRSIAWAAVDCIHNPVYGGKRPYSSIDLDTFLALDRIWTERGDYFDGVFDSKDTLLSCLYTILRAGRAQPLFVGGIISAYRDQPRTVTKAVFTPRHIVRNSLQVTHILNDDESVDDVIVEFLDNRTWQTNEIQCTMEGSQSVVPSRTDFKGITGRAQAFREGMWEAAVNSRRRILCTFDSELEGRILLRGDRIIVAHDNMQWGYSGEVRIAELIAGTWYIQTSEPIPSVGSLQFYILLRTRTGRPFGPIMCTPVDNNTLTLDPEDLTNIQLDQGMLLADVIIPDDGTCELTPYVLGTSKVTYKNWLVVTGTPRQGSKVNIACVNDDVDIYLADQAPLPTEVYPYGPGVIVDAPVVSYLSAYSGPETTLDQVQLLVSWEDYTYALSYVLQYSYDNESWSTAYQGTASEAIIYVLPGVIYLRCAGIRTVRGEFAYYTGTFGNVSVVPAQPTFADISYSASAGVLSIAWNKSARAIGYHCSVYSESVLDSGVYDTLELYYTTSSTALTITAAEITTVGGPWKNFQVDVTGYNSAGDSVPAVQAVTGVVLGTITGLSLVAPYAGSDITLQWDALQNAVQYTVNVKPNGGDSVTSATVTSTIYAITEATMESLGGPWRSITFEVIAYGHNLYSAPGLYTAELADVMFAYMFDTQDATDSSSKGVDGVISGVPTWGAGYDGEGYSWGGTSTAYITSNQELGDAYTKAMWLKFTSLTTVQHLLTSSDGVSHHMYVDASGILHIGHNSIDMLTYDITGLGTSWNHIAVTFDGSEISLYINAGLVADTVAAAVTSPSAGVYFGQVTDSFTGYADNIQHYGRALTLNEIEACRH